MMTSRWLIMANRGYPFTSVVGASRDLSMPTLAELRSRIELPDRGRATVRCVRGEARAMHRDPELAGALFQVASQINLLEMTVPRSHPRTV